MATPVPFESLLDIDGVIAAVRWRSSVVGATTASPPILSEAIGSIERERAKILIAMAEASGLSIYALSQLNHERAETDNTVVYPLDGYYVHSMRGSVVATINRVAVQLDNKIRADVQGLIGKMILVDNMYS